MARWLVRVIILSLASVFSLASAQFSYRGEVSLSAGIGLNYVKVPRYGLGDDGTPQQVGTSWLPFEQLNFSFGGHLEAEYDLAAIIDGLSTQLVLDPSASFNLGSEPELELGLTEAYALYRQGAFDVSAGLERLPLETARLNVPFSVAIKDNTRITLEPKGFFQGILGTRLSWFNDDIRLRLASFYKAEALGGAFSARGFFENFDLEAHLVYDKNLSFGLGGSAALGDIVLYGEGWFLLNRTVLVDEAQVQRNELLAALGVTGYLGDGVWTLEGAYLPSIVSTDAHLQLAGQFSLPQGEAGNLSFDVRALFLPEGVAGGLGASYTESLADQNLSLSLMTQLSARLLGLSLGANITGFF